jgi:hypothetical protein
MPRLVGLTAVVILTALVTPAGIGAAAPSQPALDDVEAAFTAAVNRERAGRGLGPYRLVTDLVAVARQHAAQMAGQHRLYHNPRLRSQVRDWEAVGENVGRGPSVDVIHRAFMDSPGHRRGLLNRRFSEVGVGVARSGADIWVVEVFRRPALPVGAVRGRPPTAPPAGPPTAPPPLPSVTDSAPAGAAPLAAAPLAAPRGWGPAGENDAVPAPVRVAASLLVLVVAAQAAVARRLRLV